jgi:hypothetical protein
MTTVMGILGGEGKIIYGKERVAFGSFSGENPKLFEWNRRWAGSGFLLDGWSAYSLGYRKDFHSNHDRGRRG